MGIYDRDYYREDSRWHNPFARSQATVFLVLLYGFLFIVQAATFDSRPRRRPDFVPPQDRVKVARDVDVPVLANDPLEKPPQDKLTAGMELDVGRVLDGEVWRVVSYAFVHQPMNIFHIGFTLFFLIWIGHQVEDLYGSREYLAYFALTTLVGGIAYTVVGAITPLSSPLVGPSGAVTAILVLFALHYPTRTINYRFFLPIPVWLLVAIYALVDIAGLANGHQNPAAVAVHLAGAGFAFVYHTYTLRVLNWLPGGRGSEKAVRRVAQPRLRVVRERPEPEPAAAASTAAAVGAKASGGGSPVDEHLEAKLDEVLEKVTRFGKESLTEEERDILLRASEIYKKRRRPG